MGLSLVRPTQNSSIDVALAISAETLVCVYFAKQSNEICLLAELIETFACFPAEIMYHHAAERAQLGSGWHNFFVAEDLSKGILDNPGAGRGVGRCGEIS